MPYPAPQLFIATVTWKFLLISSELNQKSVEWLYVFSLSLDSQQLCALRGMRLDGIDGIDGNGMERRGNGKLYTIYAMHILVLSISVCAAALTGPRKMPFICCCLALYIECCRWLHDAAAHKKQLTLYRIS